MKKLLAVFLFAFFLFTLFACTTPNILTPKTGPGTDYPCGLQGIACGNHYCCWQGDVCGEGAFSGCPVNYCCLDDSEEFGKPKGKTYHQIYDYDMLNHLVVRD